MRRLLATVLLTLVFLGGYHLGRRPNNPDILGQTKQVCDRLAQAGRQFAAEFRQHGGTP